MAPPTYERWMASTLIAMDGLHPDSDGLQPKAMASNLEQWPKT